MTRSIFVFVALALTGCHPSTPPPRGQAPEAGEAPAAAASPDGGGADRPEATAPPEPVTSKEQTMLPMSDQFLPSALTPAQLDEVEVFLGYFSPKTGAGRQEIRIKGTGEVQLLRTTAYDQPEELREAEVPRPAAQRMLEVLEDEGFFGLEDMYEQELPHGGRLMVRVTMPGGHAKQVAVDVLPEHRPPYAFARAIGAIKLVAGLATPEALGHRFFATL